MTDVLTIKQQILQQFSDLSEQDIRIDNNRIWVKAMLSEPFSIIMEYAFQELKFNNFHMTVGLDCDDYFEVIYILSNKDNIILNLRQRTISRENTAIISVFNYFENSLFHERELEDLFGLDVLGLPSGHRYPLPDKWPDGNYPLRKDWKTEFFDKNQLIYDSEAAAAAKRMAIEEENKKAALREVALAAAKAKKLEQEGQV